MKQSLSVLARAALAAMLASGIVLYLDANYASAYTYTGQRWCDRYATVVYSDSANTLPGYPVGNASATWSWIQGATPDYKINFDYYFSSSGNARVYGWTRSDGLNGKVALASWWYTPWDGCMSSGDIFFNTSYGWNTRGDACTPPTSWYHQETAALHELGHILGLNHSAYDQAVMYASLPACVFKGLDGDDRNGATSIYGTRLR